MKTLDKQVERVKELERTDLSCDERSHIKAKLNMSLELDLERERKALESDAINIEQSMRDIAGWNVSHEQQRKTGKVYADTPNPQYLFL